MATPDGWESRRVGQLADLRRGFTWKKGIERDAPAANRVPVLRIPNVQSRLELDDILYLEDVSKEERRRFRVSAGHTLLVGSNGNPARVGNCAFVDRSMDFVFASFLISASAADPDVVAPEYLFRILSSRGVQDAITESVQGSTGLKNINLGMLREVDVLLPPLPEQRKIAAILSSVDDTIERTEAVIAQLQVVKKAMMHELLTRGMPGRHTRFKQTEIGEIPEGWDVVALDACIEPDRPICYGILMPGRGHPGGVPVIKVKDIKHGRVNLDDLLLTSPELDHQYRRSRLRAGDLVLTIRGTTGRLARIPPALEAANITQDTARLSIRAGMSADYMFHALASARLQKQIQDQTRGQAVKGINIGDVRTLLVPLPPRPEQGLIESILTDMDRREACEQRVLSEARCVKAALSATLLSGDLRVTTTESHP